MTQQDLDKIRAMASTHGTTPKPQAWARLSEGLGHRKTKRRLSFYQKLSIAAAFVAVLSVGVLFTHYFSDHHNPALFASNEEFRPIVLEELGESSPMSMYASVSQYHPVNPEASVRDVSASISPARAIRVR